MTAIASESARYRYGDSARPGVVLGLGVRQAAPIVVGALWLTVFLALGAPIVGFVGPVLGAVLALGRWRGAPLHDVAQPTVRLLARRVRGRATWTPTGLRGPHARRKDVPAVLRGIEIVEAPAPSGVGTAGVVVDHTAGTVSLVLRVVGTGFPVASLREQDGLVASWGAALAPLARSRCPVARVTWQEWCHPVGLDAHRIFLDEAGGPSDDAAGRDYAELLIGQAAATIAHEVLVTVTVELARVRGAKRGGGTDRAVVALQDECRQFVGRLETAGLQVAPALSPAEICAAVRERSDPRGVRPAARVGSLAAAVGRQALEWGPMAIRPTWDEVHVDGSFHRSYRVVAWPMLPATADWLAPLLTGDAATRTVTVVMEPVPLRKAATEANRQLTSIEADQQQKERHGFRLTARERRRHADVEAREQELASGHPEFRHAAFVTVTARVVEELDDAAAGVEQAAAQAMLDIRSLVARHDQGWVASLPLGRSVSTGALA
jgi:hypothetical protein